MAAGFAAEDALALPIPPPSPAAVKVPGALEENLSAFLKNISLNDIPEVDL